MLAVQCPVPASSLNRMCSRHNRVGATGDGNQQLLRIGYEFMLSDEVQRTLFQIWLYFAHFFLEDVFDAIAQLFNLASALPWLVWCGARTAGSR